MSGSLIAELEVLELRQLPTSVAAAATNVIAINITGDAIHLTDISSGRASTGDNFSVSYTANHVVFTGTNGSEFRVGGQLLASYTASISNPVSLTMDLNRNGNSVTLTGDNSASLTNIHVNLGAGRGSNSLTLTDVIAQSISVRGGGDHSSVTLNKCQIHQNLRVNLGYSSGDLLDLESTTVSGNVSDFVGQLVISHTTITGEFTNRELGRNSTYNSTDSTYTGNALIVMGKDGVINYLYSPDGPNHTHGKVTFIGRPRHNAQIYQGSGSTSNNISPTIINDIPAHLIHTDEQVVPASSNATPTVNSLAAATTTPTITGTYASNSTVLTVTINGQSYTLGTNPQLTSPSTGQWSLDLTGSPLPTTTTSFTVTAVSTDKWGNQSTGTGTVTNQQAVIQKYVTAQNLTSSDVVTSSGLNYAVTTQGSGAVPVAGKTVAVTYTGYLLNSDGSLGTEFDSNIDGTHPSDPNPFTFVVGQKKVISGWDEAFQLLHVGSSATLIIPSSLAYGTTGAGSSIPADSILVFKVHLISST